mmetsp:Transcript_9206/g.22788  ORF Transcript_9206/g.22788 Transcript_9206/m.22788 type:complete len:674 (-) Transcript_9206:54-2075(-)
MVSSANTRAGGGAAAAGLVPAPPAAAGARSAGRASAERWDSGELVGLAPATSADRADAPPALCVCPACSPGAAAARPPGSLLLLPAPCCCCCLHTLDTIVRSSCRRLWAPNRLRAALLSPAPSLTPSTCIASAWQRSSRRATPSRLHTSSTTAGGTATALLTRPRPASAAYAPTPALPLSRWSSLPSGCSSIAAGFSAPSNPLPALLDEKEVLVGLPAGDVGLPDVDACAPGAPIPGSGCICTEPGGAPANEGVGDRTLELGGLGTRPASCAPLAAAAACGKVRCCRGLVPGADTSTVTHSSMVTLLPSPLALVPSSSPDAAVLVRERTLAGCPPAAPACDCCADGAPAGAGMAIACAGAAAGTAAAGLSASFLACSAAAAAASCSTLTLRGSLAMSSASSMALLMGGWEEVLPPALPGTLLLLAADSRHGCCRLAVRSGADEAACGTHGAERLLTSSSLIVVWWLLSSTGESWPLHPASTARPAAPPAAAATALTAPTPPGSSADAAAAAALPSAAAPLPLLAWSAPTRMALVGSDSGSATASSALCSLRPPPCAPATASSPRCAAENSDRLVHLGVSCHSILLMCCRRGLCLTSTGVCGSDWAAASPPSLPAAAPAPAAPGPAPADPSLSEPRLSEPARRKSSMSGMAADSDGDREMSSGTSGNRGTEGGT